MDTLLPVAPHVLPPDVVNAVYVFMGGFFCVWLFLILMKVKSASELSYANVADVVLRQSEMGDFSIPKNRLSLSILQQMIRDRHSLPSCKIPIIKKPCHLIKTSIKFINHKRNKGKEKIDDVDQSPSLDLSSFSEEYTIDFIYDSTKKCKFTAYFNVQMNEDNLNQEEIKPIDENDIEMTAIQSSKNQFFKEYESHSNSITIPAGLSLLYHFPISLQKLEDLVQTYNKSENQQLSCPIVLVLQTKNLAELTFIYFDFHPSTNEITITKLEQGIFQIKKKDQRSNKMFEIQDVFDLSVEDDKKENENNECVVCLTQPKDTTLIPCRHSVLCKICLQQLEKRCCPMCRTPFTGHLHWSDSM